MIVRLAQNVDDAKVAHVRSIFDFLQVEAWQTIFHGQILFVVSKKHPELEVRLQDLPYIDKIFPIPKRFQRFPLASREFKNDVSVIRTGTLSVGNGSLGIIAGPCSVESESQMLNAAFEAKKMGATGLRGGAFKPRTSPYDFQGLKEQGLKLLAKARQETGLTVVTEAMSPEEVPLVSEYADVVQIGTRNMQNYRLLEAVGQIRKPVLLKRGFSATLEEFLMAAEYILIGGNDQVILCERGIRTFETYTRFTLPLAVIPALRELTHLPVIVDPSHAVGKSTFVTPMAAAAVAAGADGLLVEVHPDPKIALCDGRQSLTFKEFEHMVYICRDIHDTIKPYAHPQSTDTPPLKPHIMKSKRQTPAEKKSSDPES